MRLWLLATAALVTALSAAAQTAPAAPPWGNPAIQAGTAPVVDPIAIPEAKGWRAEVVVDKLEHPWALAWLPNGAMLITERPGRLRVVVNGKLRAKPIGGVPEVLALRQGGLLDVSPAPDFAKSRQIYLCYSAGTAEANATRIAVGELSREGGMLTRVREIFRVSPDKAQGFHFGCRFQWLPDGTFLLGLGDGGRTRDRAGDMDAHLGKVIRLNRDGKPPADNPFHSRADSLPEIWSYGHRNIQGLTRDPAGGRLYATEHGAQGGDELNLLRAGADYGWPRVTYAVEYGQEKKPITTAQAAAGIDEPLLVFTPSIGPSGLAFYNGDKFPAWRGNLFAGGLITGARTNPGSVFRVDLDADGKMRGQEKLTMPGRVRDVRAGPDGFLYVLTDEANGQLLRIRPAK
ncbi:MAG: PQQ-dependent sugar dehydrogenase [Caulobacterales bacterium]|jgi:glucose/arabinose dehydrogenase